MVRVNNLVIKSGDLVLVQEYGSDSLWMEVVACGDKTVTVTNGHQENFEVNKSDIYQVSEDDSVLKA